MEKQSGPKFNLKSNYTVELKVNYPDRSYFLNCIFVRAASAAQAPKPA